MGLFVKKGRKLSTRPRASHPAQNLKPTNVFSYRSNRLRPEASVGRNENLLRSGAGDWRHIPAIFATVAILASAGYLLTLDSNPKIVALGSNGFLLREEQAYKNAARDILGGSLMNKTKITIDTGSFARKMKEQFPELNYVSITLPLMARRPIVELQANDPVLVLVAQSERFLLDINGRVIMSAGKTQKLSALQLPEVTDETTLDIEVGRGALTSSDTQFITNIVAQLRDKELAVESLTLPPIPSELHVRLAGLSYFVKFNMQTDPRVVSGTFIAAKQKLDNDRITPAEYIDVRVEERAYYK